MHDFSHNQNDKLGDIFGIGIAFAEVFVQDVEVDGDHVLGEVFVPLKENSESQRDVLADSEDDILDKVVAVAEAIIIGNFAIVVVFNPDFEIVVDFFVDLFFYFVLLTLLSLKQEPFLFEFILELLQIIFAFHHENSIIFIL